MRPIRLARWIRDCFRFAWTNSSTPFLLKQLVPAAEGSGRRIRFPTTDGAFAHPHFHLIDTLIPFPPHRRQSYHPHYIYTSLQPLSFLIQRTMSPSSFPPELLDSICRLLPTPDLVAVARTSYTFNAVAQRSLYKNISITPATHNLSVLDTLTAHPHTANHVRTFSIIMHGEQPHSLYNLLARALERMTELTSLTLFLDEDASWVLNSDVQYLNLASFASSFPLDSSLIGFLSRTPAVVNLQVGATLPLNDQSEINLPPTAIPNLVRFTGPYQTAQVVVPQRPVEALFLSEVISDDSVFGQLSQSKSNITIFDAVVSLGLLPCVTAISKTMPSIHYLRLMTVAPLDEHLDPVRCPPISNLFPPTHLFHPRSVTIPTAGRRAHIHLGPCFLRVLRHELDVLARFRFKARMAIESSNAES